MENLNKLFPMVPIPEELALEFLGTFARFEYALKSSGFAKDGRNAVEANWDAFARAIDWKFRRVPTKEFQAAVDFLLGAPPRKQVLVDGHLRFKDALPSPALPKAERTLLMVRRVRNNLFHGAKVWSPEYENRLRDIELIRASLCVLRGCIVLKEPVQIAYEHGAF